MHKKYTFKNGRQYGPYFYENKRVGEKVVTRYVGKDSPTKNFLTFSIVGLVVIGLIVGGFMMLKGSPTGHAVLDVDSSYVQGENLQGAMRLSLKPGELLPENSVIVVRNGEQSVSLSIIDIVSNEAVLGNFYIEDSSLSGSGSGFGVAGTRTVYPNIDFELLIKQGQGTGSPGQGSGSESPEEDSSDSDATIPEVESPEGEETDKDSPGNSENAPGQESNNGNNDGNANENGGGNGAGNSENSNSGSNNDQGSGPDNSEDSEADGSITGAVTDENEFTVSGSVSKDSDFSYNLEPGQTASIAEGSVNVDGESIPESSIDLDVEDNAARVSTEYSMEEEGFGEEFLGENGALDIEIDLSLFNISVSDSLLEVEIVYGDESIVAISEDLNIGEQNETPSNETIEVPENETIISENETIIPGNQTIPITNQTINETITNETITNQTVNLSLLQKIQDLPLIRIAQNSSADINLSLYFTGAEHYEANIKNITAFFAGESLILIPEEEFTGAVRGSVSAWLGNESVESSFTILVSSGAITVQTLRNKIVVGEPVQWIKNVTLSVPENITISLPGEATNVSIVKVEKKSEDITADTTLLSITGNVIHGRLSTEISTRKVPRIVTLFKNLFSQITGRVVDGNGNEVNSTIEVVLDDNATAYVIHYMTEAPQISENESENEKTVTVSGPDGLNYSDVIAFTNVSFILDDTQSLILYWHNYDLLQKKSSEVKTVSQIGNFTIVEELIGFANESDSSSNSSKVVFSPVEGNVTVPEEVPDSMGYIMQEIPFDPYDLDFNGEIDYIEWVVPHLSNQTFSLTIVNATNVSYSNISFHGNYSHLSLNDASPYNNLIGYWPFDVDDTSTIFDFSRLGGNGTFSNNAKTVSASYGKAADFDGSDYGQVYPKVTVQNLQNFTVSLWFRRHNVTDDTPGILRGFGGSGWAESWRISGQGVGNPNIVPCIWNSSGGGSCPNLFLADTVDKWYYMAITYNNGTGNFTGYVNGVATFTDTVAGGIYYPSPATTDVVLATCNGCGSLNGSIDELMMFNISLNGQQILDIYNNQSVRFVSQGIIEGKQFNITKNLDYSVNITTDDFMRDAGSNISARIGRWDVSQGYNDTDQNLVVYYHFDQNHSDSSGKNLYLTPQAPGSSASMSTNSYSASGDYYVPAGANTVMIKAWGKGGNGYNVVDGASGGGGGFVRGNYSVQQGDFISISISSRIVVNLSRSVSSSNVTFGILVPGSGGNSGTGVEDNPGMCGGGPGNGGPGGGATGGDGMQGDGDTDWGNGGTQTAGGSGGTHASNPSYNGSTGSRWSGGAGGVGYSNGGSGGEGWYGGGGGSAVQNNGDCSFAAGGGGGSGNVTNGTDIQNIQGTGGTPGGSTDPDYPGSNFGSGGTSSHPAGYGGYVIVKSYSPATGATPVFNDSGVYNGSIKLNGTSSLISPQSAAISSLNATNLSVCAWIKELATPSNDRVIVASANTTTFGLWSSYNTGGSANKFGFQTARAGGISIFDTTTHNANQWYFVCGLSDISSGKMYLYVDGVEKSSYTTGWNGLNPLSNISVGSWTGFSPTIPTNPNASIDEVMLFNKTLSQSQISELYVKGRANWDYTNYKNITSVNATRASTAFPIKNTTTNVLSSFKLISNKQFYTPYLGGAAAKPLNLSFSEYDLIIPDIRFVAPTQPNRSIINKSNGYLINATLYATSLSSIIFNWNGTSYTLYNNSLLLFYNFDNRSDIGENQTRVVDISPYGIHGTLQNGVIVNQTGRFNGGMTFDGLNDGINISDASSTLESQNFSVSVWVQPRGYQGSRTIVSKYGYSSGDKGWELRVSGLPNRVSWGGFSAGGGGASFNSIANITPGAWTHLVATYNGGGTFRMYVNGVLDGGSATITTPIGYATGVSNLSIGYKHWGGSEFFNGSIDEVMIFNRTLSADEVQHLYDTNIYKFNSTQWVYTTNRSSIAQGEWTYNLSAMNKFAEGNKSETRSIGANYLVTYECRTFNISGTYYQGKDLNNGDVVNMTANPSNIPLCHVINAPDVFLDCLGHSISNSTTFGNEKAAILISNNILNARNATVQNCNITVSSAFGHYGIMLYGWGSSDAAIKSNNISGAYRGMYVLNGANTTIMNNTIVNITVGIHVREAGTNNYSILGNYIRQIGDTGILIFDGVSSITIAHNNISNSTAVPGYGIFIQDGSYGHYIYNNSISNLIQGIAINTRSDNLFKDNQILGVDNGILASDSVFAINGDRFHNITIINVTARESVAVSILYGTNITIVNSSSTSSSSYGYSFDNVENLTLINSTAVSNTLPGFYFLNLSNSYLDNLTSFGDRNGLYFDFILNKSVFSRINITNPDQEAVVIANGWADNNNFSNLTIRGTNAGYRDLRILASGADNNYLIDTIIGNYSIEGGTGSKLFFRDTGEGEIRFLSGINGTGVNLSDYVRIGNNTAFVNSTFSDLNKPANISLFDIPYLNHARILRDGLNCLSSTCSNFSALNGSVVSFNVSGWSNYSIGNLSVSATNCSTGCFYVRNSAGLNKTIFDKYGNVDTKGSLTEGSVGSPDGNDLIFKDAAGITVAWIDDSTGNVRLAGTLAHNQGTACTPPANSFIIRNESGGCVSYIDSSGNIWLKGGFTTNALL